MIDVKEKISTKDKMKLRNLAVELTVLKNLFQERQTLMKEAVKEVMTPLTPHPELYELAFDPGKDIWELRLLKGALVVPGMEVPPLRN